MPVPVAKKLTRQPYWTPARRQHCGGCYAAASGTTLQRVGSWRWVLVCVAAAMLAGCTRLVGGAADLAATQTPGPMLPAGVDVEQIMLETAQMRGITGADEHLTIIPTMDVKSPADIGPLAETVPAQCRFVYAETAIFGTETTQFRKTTFQAPPEAALISEAVAAYRHADTARRVFQALVDTVAECADTPPGATLVGDWDADVQSLRTGAGRCGSSYRLKAAVLLEVTFCGFPRSVSEIVIANLAANVPD